MFYQTKFSKRTSMGKQGDNAIGQENRKQQGDYTEYQPVITFHETQELRQNRDDRTANHISSHGTDTSNHHHSKIVSR